MDKVIGHCENCENEVYDDDFLITLDTEYKFCGEYCVANFITKHPRTIMEILTEKGLLKK